MRSARRSALFPAVLAAAYVLPCLVPGARDLAHELDHALDAARVSHPHASGHAHAHEQDRSRDPAHDGDADTRSHVHDGFAGVLLSLDLAGETPRELHETAPRFRTSLDLHTAAILPQDPPRPAVVQAERPAELRSRPAPAANPPDPPPRA